MGEDPTQKHFPAPAPRGSDAPETLAPDSPGRPPRPSRQPRPLCSASSPREASRPFSFPYRSTFRDARSRKPLPPRLLTPNLFVSRCNLAFFPRGDGEPFPYPGAHTSFLGSTLSFFCLLQEFISWSLLSPSLSLLLPKERQSTEYESSLPSSASFVFPLRGLQPLQTLFPSLTRCSVGTPMPQLPVTSLSQDPLTSLRGGREDEHLVRMAMLKMPWDIPAVC